MGTHLGLSFTFSKAVVADMSNLFFLVHFYNLIATVDHLVRKTDGVKDYIVYRGPYTRSRWGFSRALV